MALSQLEQDAWRIVDRLNALGVGHAIVGGLAVSARTEPRLTRDIDIAISVESDLAAERLIRALSQDGHTPAALIEQEATGRIATVRLTETTADRSGSIVDHRGGGCRLGQGHRAGLGLQHARRDGSGADRPEAPGP